MEVITSLAKRGRSNVLAGLIIPGSILVAGDIQLMSQLTTELQLEQLVDSLQFRELES